MREGWEEVKLKEVTKMINGFAFKSKDFSEFNEVPIVKIKSLKNEKLVIDKDAKVSESFLQLDKKYHINNDDILIALTGSHITLPASAVGRVAKSRLKETLLLNQRVGKFEVKEEVCDHNFLFYLLISDYFFENIGLRSRGASNQANISGKDILDIKINLPPLKTQQKIASILSAYDDLIENNLKRIKLLEEQAQQTYEEWFVRFKFPGHEEVVFDEETGLPEGWEKKKLSEMADFLNGYAFKPKDSGEKGMPIIKIKEMRNGLNNTSPRNLGDKVPEKYLVERGDILFSWSGTLMVTLWNFERGLLNQHLFKVTPKTGFGYAYVFLSTKTSLKIFNALATGATMKHIKRKELDFVELPFPNNFILNDFESKVRPLLKLSLNLNFQNQLLKEARDILLPQLMMGMIDVDELLSNEKVYDMSKEKVEMAAEEGEDYRN